ncbi:MAG: hypothetical protein ACI9WH_002082 [Glaciecola sp.]
MQANGTFRYTHNGDDPVGDSPSFTYTLSDGFDSDIGTVIIAVAPLNDAPVAQDDNFEVNEGETVTGNVITHNDGDGLIDTDGGDGADLSITQVNGTALEFIGGEASVTIVNDPNNGSGTLLIKADGSFTYTNIGFILGSAPPSFTYTLSDGTNTDTGTVTINVIDSAPEAKNDANFIEVVQGVQTTVFGNTVGRRGNSGDQADSSIDGFGSPIITQVVYNDGFADVIITFSDTDSQKSITTAFGTLSINSDGRYNFETLNGLTPQNEKVKFEYTIQDGDSVNAETSSATLTINLSAAPAPAPAAFSVDLDESVLSSSNTIDTGLIDESTPSANEGEVDDNANIEGLGDIITDSYAQELDQYLADISGDSVPIGDIGQAVIVSNIEKESIVLDKDGEESEHASSPTISNGLLAEGAVIISDATAPTSVPIAELDSSDTL